MALNIRAVITADINMIAIDMTEEAECCDVSKSIYDYS
jgi:hypothetical protein